MAETVYHLRRAEHNVAVSDHLQHSSGDFIDWAITTRFYAALHLVDALLGQMDDLEKDEQHPRKHSASNSPANGGRGRNQLVSAFMGPVAREYRSLYELSRRSRYDVKLLGDDTLGKALDQFEKIEKYVRMQLIARGAPA